MKPGKLLAAATSLLVLGYAALAASQTSRTDLTANETDLKNLLVQSQCGAADSVAAAYAKYDQKLGPRKPDPKIAAATAVFFATCRQENKPSPEPCKVTVGFMDKETPLSTQRFVKAMNSMTHFVVVASATNDIKAVKTALQDTHAMEAATLLGTQSFWIATHAVTPGDLELRNKPQESLTPEQKKIVEGVKPWFDTL